MSLSWGYSQFLRDHLIAMENFNDISLFDLIGKVMEWLNSLIQDMGASSFRTTLMDQPPTSMSRTASRCCDRHFRFIGSGLFYVQTRSQSEAPFEGPHFETRQQYELHLAPHHWNSSSPSEVIDPEFLQLFFLMAVPVAPPPTHPLQCSFSLLTKEGTTKRIFIRRRPRETNRCVEYWLISGSLVSSPRSWIFSRLALCEIEFLGNASSPRSHTSFAA